jgi:hypothetical protein
MTNLAKNATAWIPPSRFGSYIDLGAAFIVDNSGNFIVDNSGNFLVTTNYVLTGAYATSWTPTPAS